MKPCPNCGARITEGWWETGWCVECNHLLGPCVKVCGDCTEYVDVAAKETRCPLCGRDSLIDEDAWETYEELHEIAYESEVERIAGRQERESA